MDTVKRARLENALYDFKYGDKEMAETVLKTEDILSEDSGDRGGIPQDLLDKVTRITIVDETGRAYEKYNIPYFEFHFQDDDRTMKIFITAEEEQGNKSDGDG